MVITRGGFSQVLGNAFAGLGFPAEGPSVYEFPIAMFTSASDLTPINENIDKIVYGLTKWQPKIATKGIFHPEMVTVQGKDYQNAVDNLNALFLKNMWGAGLPIVPPTVERVKWIMTGTDLAPDTVIAKTVDPRGGIADVTSIAIALAMAGWRPEYLPVLIAAVQDISDPAWGLKSLNPTTNSNIPVVIVNGPIARQIRLGSGYGILGPDPLHPAGEVIGRAIRYIQQDLGGAIPGIGTMAIYGGMRATNAVFAEDEEGLPKNWNSLAVDRGFAKTDNVVTVNSVSGMNNSTMGATIPYGTKPRNDQILLMVGKFMSMPYPNTWSSPSTWADPNRTAGMVLLPRGFADSLVTVNGYSKMDVKTYLWNKSKLPWSVAVETGQDTYAGQLAALKLPTGQDVPLTSKPEQLTVVVAGGDQSGHNYWMQPSNTSIMLSTKTQLPKNWDALLKQAETDLGPAPAVH